MFDRSAGAAAPWADKARSVFEAHAKRASRVKHVPYGVEHQQFLEAIEAAVAAGCDDPLILYWKVHLPNPHKVSEA